MLPTVIWLAVIPVGNITSISGVAPGLTQAAQAATEAFAAYVNSQGGICGRTLKVVTYDDQNDAGQNAADVTQACNSTFALVGSASGFDNGGASAVQSCGIPYMAAEISTHELGNVPNAWGATPGNAHYWPTGPAAWLKSQYPNAVTHAAMIYLNAPATQEQATAEVQAYQQAGFNYIYQTAVSPTEPNYAPYVAKMQSAGVQYVTEYSDDNSAARLLQSMAQANYQPQVVDWFAEEYSQHFLAESQGNANGNLVLMATAPYEEAGSNPGMQLFLNWLNRVAPGTKHDIFGQLAWSAGLAFLQAAKAAGTHLTRAALLQQLGAIGQWDGGGVQAPDQSLGQHIPSHCFSYFKIQGSSFVRVYPSQPNTFDCNSGGVVHY
jgi:ABC-type branched-subunit amino acid transport system substrate-binding protein